MRFLLAVAVLGCGARADHPEPIGGPPYLGIFGSGKAWTLATSDGMERAACRIAAQNRLGDATVAHLQCAKPHDDLGVVGWWVASPAGLYHPATQPENPDELAGLSEDDLLINARASERHHEVNLGAAHETIDAERFERGWCVSSATAASGARREWTLCFDDRGIIGVADLVDFGSGAAAIRFGALPAPEIPDPP
ncbi:MAG TPA: hypothetical protein VH143_11880 [Kofleriaceae bacterium]|nr:hypothetical protein [Kofleriaceae bacterium]